MEKKEIDVKFIVGIVILLVIFGVVGGSFWNLGCQTGTERQTGGSPSGK